MQTTTSPAPTFRALLSPAAGVDTELLFMPVFGPDDDLADVGDLDAAVGGQWQRARDRRVFTHKPYASVLMRVTGRWKAQQVCVVGVGARAEADAGRWRRVAATCSHIARQHRVESCGWLVRTGCDAAAIAAAAADGLSAAEFTPGVYKSDSPEPSGFPRRIDVIVPPGSITPATAEAAVHRGRIAGRAVNTTRVLANEPSNELTPAEFARRVADLGRGVGLTVDVLEPDRIAELGMRLTLAVGQGSAAAPRVVVLTHSPAGAPASPVLGLVGKGVTFDTGGISIKPAESMDRMKGDMAGGAAVAAAMWAIAALQLPVRVVAVIPMAENMLGSRAFRPGDVIRGASGKTVEILNTDAEGRLLLADGLWYARELGATHLLDIATLTGHCVIGLGRTVAGLIGSPDEWVEQVRQQAALAGDRVWPLPIYEEAQEQLRSDVADLANIGGRPGGAITAAAFLREFSSGLPWAHIDIAGPAWAETAAPHQPKGPTGAGVRTLIEVARAATSQARKD